MRSLPAWSIFPARAVLPNCSLPAPCRLLDGTPLLISRTGYTGEFGFELFVAGEHLVHCGRPCWPQATEFGLLPCGLAARDSLRAGAVLPLSHQDIGPWKFTHNPWQFALPWQEGGTFSKDFLGAGALLADSPTEYTWPLPASICERSRREKTPLLLICEVIQ
jgi:aminomethyltransferase